MTAYQFIKKALKESGHKCSWRYHGPGYGQGFLHKVGLLDAHEVVTCAMGYGWLGSCEDFLKQFDLVN